MLTWNFDVSHFLAVVTWLISVFWQNVHGNYSDGISSFVTRLHKFMHTTWLATSSQRFTFELERCNRIFYFNGLFSLISHKQDSLPVSWFPASCNLQEFKCNDIFCLSRICSVLPFLLIKIFSLFSFPSDWLPLRGIITLLACGEIFSVVNET